MPFKLDHVIVGVQNLEQAIADYQALGFNAFYGGRHASGTTHNGLICFRDGSYIELLALTGEAPANQDAIDFRSFLDEGQGLIGYALLSDDLEADTARLRSNGIQVGEVLEGGRKRPDGQELRWKTAFLEGSQSPFLIQDVTPRNLRVPNDPAITQQANEVFKIEAVQITTPLQPKSLHYYEQLLGVVPHPADLPDLYAFPLEGASVLVSISETTNQLTVATTKPPETQFELERTHGVKFGITIDLSESKDGDES